MVCQKASVRRKKSPTNIETMVKIIASPGVPLNPVPTAKMNQTVKSDPETNILRRVT